MSKMLDPRWSKAPALSVRLPEQLPFTAGDLASGRDAFSIRWRDPAPDADPDAYRGLYPSAMLRFSVTLGEHRFEMPLQQARLEVSDGGGGGAYRELVRLQASHSIAGSR